MCGIAGIIDLAGQRSPPDDALRRMAAAITHRGPDEEGFLEHPGIGLASRRLSIVDLADGQQPMTNEERNLFVVFNGELFDYVERRAELVRQGHQFRTHCDTEIIPHLWEDHRRRDVGTSARTICDRAVGRTPAPTASRPRSLRHRSAFLESPGGLASVCFGN